LPPKPKLGRVSLVGAGPGDPGLLTIRGRTLLEQADVIYYDNLAAPAVLGYAPRTAEKIYVGKKRADHAISQDELSNRLVAEANKGRRVVRLKGGDPYIFGRGGEEAQALAAAGVAFEVVPGVTSAVGAAAYAGIPLTHRDHTHAVTFVTGHDADALDWNALATTQTLVIFMGLTSMADISSRLQAAGRSAQTPAAAIRWGTRGDQQTVDGTLADLAERVAEHQLKPPALVVIGEVVALRQSINWFENLPLFGQSIVVTRAAEQAGELSSKLRALGAQVIELPTIAFEPPESLDAVKQAIEALESYDWIVFTSANGVRFFLEYVDASLRDLRSIRAKLCAIGPATAEALAKLHLKVDVIPDEFVAESVAEAFDKYDISGRKILIPRAEVAREFLPTALRDAGASVDVVSVYRSVIPDESRTIAAGLWNAGDAPNWVTVTSSSTVTNLAQLVPIDQLKNSRFASIGPITSRTTRELGLEVAVEPSSYTTEGLIAALVSHLDGE
jgi:uroporphyrinogen III methyltransferase/synthase